MGRHGPHARHLIRTNRHPQSRPTDEKSPIGFAFFNKERGFDGEVWVGGFVGRGERAYVVHRGDEGIGIEVGG